MERKVGGLLLIFLLGILLSGCATAELEDRNFPTELVVQDTESFSQEFMEMQGTGNRMIDYSHLKVIILSQAFLEDGDAMQEFLHLLEERNEIPHNTYLVVAEDAEKMMEMQDVLGESVGSYLEQMFENVSQVNKQEYPTIGMLYQEEDNRNQTLFIPYISAGEEELLIEKYYVWRRGEAYGTVDGPTAMLSFFTRNQMNEYQMTLAEDVVVSLFDAHNDIMLEEINNKKVVTAKIQCSGEVRNRRDVSEKEQQALEQQIEVYMNDTAAMTLDDGGVDVTDSFHKLGGMRDWYFYFQGQEERYEQEIEIKYEVDVDWVNL